MRRMIPPNTARQQVGGKTYYVYGSGFSKSEARIIQKKAQKSFIDTRIIDGTMKRREGKPEPVQLYTVLVRRLKKNAKSFYKRYV